VRVTADVHLWWRVRVRVRVRARARARARVRVRVGARVGARVRVGVGVGARVWARARVRVRHLGGGGQRELEVRDVAQHREHVGVPLLEGLLPLLGCPLLPGSSLLTLYDPPGRRRPGRLGQHRGTH